MDHVRQADSDGVVSYVARDGDVIAVRSARPRLAGNEVRVGVELTTLGSWGMFSGQGVERLGDTFVGRVIECGVDVDPSCAGQRVLGIVRAGAAADELVVPAFGVRACDESHPAAVVAATATSGLVACLLAHAVEPAPGATVVVAGGFGVSCVLAGLVRGLGAIPIAVRDEVSDPSLLIEAGFAAVLDASRRPYPEALRSATGGRLADVLIDTGQVPARWSDVEALLEPTGRAFTSASSDRSDWDPLRSTSVGVIALAMRYVAAEGDVIGRLADQIDHLVDEVVAGRLVLPVEVFPAEQAQAAYDRARDLGRVARVAVRLTPGP